jgi:hypothetical protein
MRCCLTADYALKLGHAGPTSMLIRPTGIILVDGCYGKTPRQPVARNNEVYCAASAVRRGEIRSGYSALQTGFAAIAIFRCQPSRQRRDVASRVEMPWQPAELTPCLGAAQPLVARIAPRPIAEFGRDRVSGDDVRLLMP